MRATNSIAIECASASITKLTTVPARLKIRTGRRPYLSDRSPSAGAATSWHAENTANSRPMVSGDAPNVSRVERQQRNDDAEADQVDEDGEEDDQQRTCHSWVPFPARGPL